jgi:hypothetical protein
MFPVMSNKLNEGASAMRIKNALRVFGAMTAAIVLVLGAAAQAEEPELIRGQITKVEGSVFVVKNGEKTYKIGLPDTAAILALSEGSFTKVEYGVYVGAVAVKLDAYSPIVRDSLSWLHRGFELRIIDEELRGIASGHQPWNLTNETIIAHGWVDDMEGRVLSIKYGPTEAEETDVEVPRDKPVLRMSLGDKTMIKPDAHVTASAVKGANGQLEAAFVFVGKDGIVPPL